MRTIDAFRGGRCFQIALLRVEPERYFFYERGHHLVIDGASASIFADRVCAAYAALAAGQLPAFDDPGSCFSVYDEEEAYRASERFQKDREYWLEQVRERPDTLTLSRKSPARAQSFIRAEAIASSEITARIRDSCAACSATVPQFVTAAAAAYLARLTGVDDLIVGMPVMGRIGARMRRIVASVTNVLPLRLQPDTNAGFGVFLEQVGRRMREALRHQRYRGEDIRRDLGLRPDEPDIHGTLVNIMAFEYARTFAGFPCREHNLSNGPVDDLAIVAYDRLDTAEMRIFFNANPAHYTEELLRCHASRFLRFLAALVAEPADTPLRSIPVLDQSERCMVIVTANGESQAYREQTLVHLFEEQAERSPDAVAVIAGESRLSYRALNCQANQLAHWLIAQGARPETLVGIVTDRSIDLLVELLAVLKSGAGYLPVDPETPAARREQILADARPVLVLNGNHDPAVSGYPKFNPTDRERLSALRPSHPAYVIHTSGSTGIPKGVIVTHANVARLFAATRKWFDVGSEDVWTLFHSTAFDFSVWEMWGALLTGGKLLVVPRMTTRSSADFLRLLAEEGVTVLNQTPSAYYQLIQSDQDHPELGARLTLRYVIFGGEALELARLANWYTRHSDRSPILVNMYGITETTVHVTYFPIDRPTAAQAGASIIGRNIGDLRVYVLDDALEPAPVGISGEMYVSGAGLARGYLNRPGLTAERFVADPFSDRPGARMYRTGDLARRTPDGMLEYLGRADQQVKVRGFRIEPGEIEAVLLQQDGVKQVAVVARDHPSGKQLVAYVVLAHDVARDAKALRDRLGERLPAYMVPTAIVFLEQLPVSSNGKLERKLLPPPALMSGASRSAPPRSTTELAIAKAWQNVLGAQARIGVDDNFFDLGGHSLMMTQVLADIRSAVTSEVTITDLFRFPTVGSISAYIDRHLPNGTAAPPEPELSSQLRNELRRDVLARRAAARSGETAAVSPKAEV